VATEHEIDRMVVRLVGNQEDYQKMLKDVEQQTEKSAKWAEEQGSKITKAFTSAFKAAQGAISSTGSGLGQIGQTMRQPAQQQKETLGKAALDFSEYGKSIKDMVRESEKAGKEAEELMKRTVKGTEAYKELEKIIKLNTKEMQVFKLMSDRTGISVGELSKTIKVGSEEYEKWRKETEKFGMMFDDESLKKADELAESWKRVRQAIQGMWNQIGSIVSDRFKELNERIEGIVTWVIKWIKENKELIARSVDVAAKIGAVGIAVSALGTALSTVGALLGPITVAIAAGVAAWTLWKKESSEALNTDLLTQYADNFKGLYNQVVGYGKQIIDYVSKVMDGVFNAIKAGKLELAVEIAWSGVKVFWMRSMKELNDLTNEQFGAIFNNLATGDWQKALEALWIEIQIIWNKGVVELKPYWDQIVDMADTAWTAIQMGWNTLVDKIKGGINELVVALQGLLAGIAQRSPYIANKLGINDLAEYLGSVPFMQKTGADDNELLQQELEGRRRSRSQASADSDFDTLVRIAELETQKAEAMAEGNEAAAEALSIAQEELQAKLNQADAEAALADSQRARARDLQRAHDEELEFQQRRTKIEQERQGIVERYDPVEKYRRELKQLNALFNEAERGSATYKRALRDMQDELSAGLFVWEAQFGNIGFDAVQKGTSAHQQLIQAGLQENEMDRARQMGVAQAGERDAKAEEDAQKDKEFTEILEHGKSLSAIAGFCGRMAAATEKTADQPKVHLAPLPEFM